MTSVTVTYIRTSSGVRIARGEAQCVGPQCTEYIGVVTDAGVEIETKRGHKLTLQGSQAIECRRCGHVNVIRDVVNKALAR